MLCGENTTSHPAAEVARGAGEGVKAAFTLAEILITLGIVGVVAAMTLPTLIAKINNTVNTDSAKIFSAKLIKGLNLTKTAGDLNNTYISSYDFLVNGLGKNLKMSKVCDSDHINDCMPYAKIKYEYKRGKEKNISVKDIKTASELNLNSPFTDVAAFVMADGTPVIASYNLQCIVDADKADTTINSCFAGIFDINGSRKPNKFGTIIDTDGKTVKSFTGDIRAFNGAKIGSNCFGIIGDLCITESALVANDNLLSLIQAVDSSYTMPKFTNDSIEKNDYWQLSNDYCEKVEKGKLPTMDQLGQIATALYYDESDGDKTIKGYQDVFSLTMKNKDSIYAALGLSDNSSSFQIWSSEQQYNPTVYACSREYASAQSQYWIGGRGDRGRDYLYVLCLAND